MTDAAAPRPWRCFVAVPLPDGLRQELRAWVDEVRGDGTVQADWRWADPEGWHITLAFLGATPPDAVPVILDALADASTGRQPFDVEAGGLGAFPGRRNARVLWYGIQDEKRQLRSLAEAVRAATGSDKGSPFRPHVTLARARDRHGVELPPLSVETIPSGRVQVSAIQLMRSVIGHGPAHYQTLGEAPLGTHMAMGWRA